MLDWVVINCAYVLALKLHPSTDFDVLSGEPLYVHPEILFFVAYSVVILLIFQMNQLYKINVYLSIRRQLQYLAKALFYSAIGIALLSFFTKSRIIVDSRLVLLYFLIGAFTLLAIVRVLFFRTLFKLLVTYDLFAIGADRGRRAERKETGDEPNGAKSIRSATRRVPRR